VIRFSVVLTVLLLSSACSPLPAVRDGVGYTWVKSRPAVAEERWRYHVVSKEELKKACYPKSESLACAWTTENYYYCDIYLPLGHSKYIRWHEERHCRGWTH